MQLQTSWGLLLRLNNHPCEVLKCVGNVQKYAMCIAHYLHIIKCVENVQKKRSIECV